MAVPSHLSGQLPTQSCQLSHFPSVSRRGTTHSARGLSMKNVWKDWPQIYCEPKGRTSTLKASPSGIPSQRHPRIISLGACRVFYLTSDVIPRDTLTIFQLSLSPNFSQSPDAQAQFQGQTWPPCCRCVWGRCCGCRKQRGIMRRLPN